MFCSWPRIQDLTFPLFSFVLIFFVGCWLWNLADSATDGSSKVINELQSQIKDACAKVSLEEEKVLLHQLYLFFFFFLFCLSWKVLRRSEDPFLFIFGDLQNKKLAAENAKLQYRIQHLVQAVRDGDDKLEKMKVSYNL